MALKDILAVVDDTPAMGSCLETAIALATRHDAHLTGLHVSPPVALPGAMDSRLVEEIIAAQQDAEVRRVSRLAAQFNSAVARAGLFDRSEWRRAGGNQADVVALHARYADLVVMGQRIPDFYGDVPQLLPDDLIFVCGRPVLVVPYAGQFETVGQRVLVGWNGSREAARALADAMPILERAKKVTLLAVSPKPGPGGLGDAPCADIARHLARHGVVAEAAYFAGADPHEVGDALLNHVSDLGCDLIVMGAYGQSRFRTMVLGSLTGFLLRHMTVPVLMCH